MTKQLGFSRKMELDWLDIAAGLKVSGLSTAEMRERLLLVISDTVKGPESQRKTIDGLMMVWDKSEQNTPEFYEAAALLLQKVQEPNERIALHYGLVLVTYDLFRRAMAIVGRGGKLGAELTLAAILSKVAGEIGHFGGLDRSVGRVLESVKEWGIVAANGKPQRFSPIQTKLQLNSDFQRWLIACALYAHPSDHLPIQDLAEMSELFPFTINLTLEQLKADPRFEVQRQGGNLTMVGLTKNK